MQNKDKIDVKSNEVSDSKFIKSIIKFTIIGVAGFFLIGIILAISSKMFIN